MNVSSNLNNKLRNRIMNVLRAFGTVVIKAAETVAFTPIYVAEHACKAGEVTSRGVKKAAAWSEEKCGNGVVHCQDANKQVSAFAEEKQVLVEIKTARSVDELPDAKDFGAKSKYCSQVIAAYKDKKEELEAKAAAEAAAEAEAAAAPA
jgi:hypothetical protein